MRHFAVPLSLALVLALGACDDSGVFIHPILSSDTVALGAQTAGTDLPTALDVTALGGFVHGGRRPELETDAQRWDFVIQRRGDELVFVPAGVLGMLNLIPSLGVVTSGITEPVNGKTFETLREAPGRDAFVTDSVVAVVVGGLYVARSRQLDCGFSVGEQYAKLLVLDADPTAGTVQIQITTNEVCSDPRLVEVD